jgi:hypothetical protein
MTIDANAVKAVNENMKLQARMGRADWGEDGWLVGWAFIAPDGIEDFWTESFCSNASDAVKHMQYMIEHGRAVSNDAA